MGIVKPLIVVKDECGRKEENIQHRDIFIQIKLC